MAKKVTKTVAQKVASASKKKTPARNVILSLLSSVLETMPDISGKSTCRIIVFEFDLILS